MNHARLAAPRADTAVRRIAKRTHAIAFRRRIAGPPVGRNRAHPVGRFGSASCAGTDMPESGRRAGASQHIV
ncbi:hypothetical protein DF122_30705 [Burkholderia pseudomallei]|nr:hypothetical protein BOC35_06125 [Burkholderia pseudomallei]ARL25114.1 hypothetical protein BOC47_22080 [Burkholderia pseudomallei]ARL33257.1 hypothetical protein BOC48_29150 [Burkholderia pseudomallei]ARL77234.1 hypothetical protein BOC54_34840 [Burkholderia pseudomallei]ARL83834.1 hypothetical protein BOC55_33165 [Burkholderia pseudomallei]